ncbi:hypothetical protein [Prescottella agglutinans]|uniref:Major tail protein n=1 Tax=Prescottella agglutinans TaxID=1644129 RepID=A0ABT6MER5_9NOCA|nr:hypothetical protein [Prescottella agglutinans]MDH6282803.1 hypothetical protein [Prescottella agglutinans]
MAAATFEDIANFAPELIRKPLKGAILVAPIATNIPAAFTTGATADLQELTGFKSLGHTAKDAPPSFKPEVKSSDVESWGSLEPTRTDIISRDLSVSFTSQETKKETLEMYSGIDLSAVKADSTTKEIQYNDPTSPSTRYHRMIFLAVDGSGADAIYILKILPRAMVSEVGEQSWNPENALSYPLTVKAKVDSTLGYSVKNVICGPGVAPIVQKMGFAIATP